jgi:hypothetical protein
MQRSTSTIPEQALRALAPLTLRGGAEIVSVLTVDLGIWVL